jgi:hypothetical protein
MIFVESKINKDAEEFDVSTGSSSQEARPEIMVNERSQQMNDQDKMMFNQQYQQMQPKYPQNRPVGNYNMMPQMYPNEANMQMPNPYIQPQSNSQIPYPMNNQIPAYPMAYANMSGFMPPHMPPQYMNNPNMNK